MAIIAQSIVSYLLQGDGSTTTWTFDLGWIPTAVTLVAQIQMPGSLPVSIVNTVSVAGEILTVNFTAPFSYLLQIYVNFTPMQPEVVTISNDLLPLAISATVGVPNSAANPIFVEDVTGSTVAVSNFPATQPVSGTVAVTQSTSPWVIDGNLTHNNAAPIADNLGALVAVASSAAPTYNAGDQVLLSTDLAGNLRVLVGSMVASNNITEWASVVLGAPTTYGTAPTGNTVIGVNAFITNTPAVTLASTTITGTVAVTQSTSPWVVSGTVTTTPPANATTDITQWANTTLGVPTNFGTTPGAVIAGSVNASIFAGTTALAATGSSLNVDVTNTVPVTLTSTTITGTVAVTQSTSPWVVSLTSTTITNTVAVDGALTNNNAVPAATNLGVLAFIAATAYATETYTNGDQVLAVTDLHGALNHDLQAIAGTAVVTAAAGVQKVGIVGNTGAAIDGVITAATAPTNGIAVLGVYESTVPALTTGQAVAQQVDTVGSQYVNLEGRKATYRASSSFSPAAGDVAVLPGSATKTIRVTRIALSLSNSGSSLAVTASAIVRSTADSGGTHAAMAAVPMDSNYAAASAAPLQYTAAPTLGTAVGAIATQTMMDLNSSQQSATQNILWSFGTGSGNSALVLRGVAQQICVHLAAVVSTQTVTVDFEWTEE